jgi:hypothetical protein
VLAGLGQRAATLGLIYAAERNVLLALQIYQHTAGQPIAVPQEIFLNVHALVGSGYSHRNDGAETGPSASSPPNG